MPKTWVEKLMDHEPLTEPLTAEELKALADGVEVIITWSGGNGPHHYAIEQAGGTTYAQPLADPHGPLRWYNPISFVGRERFHTRVWLAQFDGEATP